MDHRPTKPTSKQTQRDAKKHLCAGAQLQNREEIRQIVTQHITCSRQGLTNEKQDTGPKKHQWSKKSVQIIHSQAKILHLSFCNLLPVTTSFFVLFFLVLGRLNKKPHATKKSAPLGKINSSLALVGLVLSKMCMKYCWWKKSG